MEMHKKKCCSIPTIYQHNEEGVGAARSFQTGKSAIPEGLGSSHSTTVPGGVLCKDRIKRRLQKSAVEDQGIPWSQNSLGAGPAGATCPHKWAQNATNTPTFYGFGNNTPNGLELAEKPQRFPGILRNEPGPCSSCFRRCYISPSPPCSFFTSVGATIPGALTSFGVLQPPHPFFHHSPDSTWAKNSCCNRSPATWECSKLIINRNEGREINVSVGKVWNNYKYLLFAWLVPPLDCPGILYSSHFSSRCLRYPPWTCAAPQNLG